MANKYHSIEINYVVTEKTNVDNDNASVDNDNTSVKNENKSGETDEKEDVNLFDTKASFVAGVVVIMTIIRDAIDSLCSIPIWSNLVMFFIGLALFWIVLGTKTFDGLFNKNIEGAERFGSILTVASIIVFLLERLVLDDENGKTTQWFLISYNHFLAVTFIVLAVLVLGTSWLLCSNKSKKEHKE